MKIKIIGGERDDEYWEVDTNRYRVGDWIRLPEKLKNFNLDDIVPQTITYHEYILDGITVASNKYGPNVLYYLRPSDWDISKALEYQFSKRCLQNLKE